MANGGNVILVGAMASGKSTIGWLLARLIGYGFIDIDQLIEAQEGKPVAQLFEEKGEDAFRKIEAQIVQGLAGIRSHVIATGGGSVTDDASWELLQSLGCSVWLNAPPEEIARRLLGEPEQLQRRPLLADVLNVELAEQRQKLLAERLKALIGQRQARYKEARLPMSMAFATPEQGARMLKDALVRESILPLKLDQRLYDRWNVL